MKAHTSTLTRTVTTSLAVVLSGGLTGFFLGLAYVFLSRADMGAWSLARAAGLVSYLLLTAVTALGLLLACPPRRGRRFFNAIHRLRLHVLLACFALVFVLLHTVVLAVDPWAHVGWTGALLPFGSQYRPVPVTLGLLALWSGLVSGISAALAGRGAGRFWVPLHRVAALAWVLAWLHGLLAGSDTGPLTAVYVVTGLGVLALAWRRAARRSPQATVAELARQRMPHEEVLL